MKFNFPATRFVHLNTEEEQIEHIVSEFEEAGAEAEISLESEELHLELVDIFHSLETFFRILAENRTQEYVNNLFRLTEEKNRVRGYYAD